MTRIQAVQQRGGHSRVRGWVPVLLVAASLAGPAGAHAQGTVSCADTLELALHDFADARSDLARALSITTAWAGEGSGIFEGSVRSVRVCTDSAAFVRAWTDPPRSTLSLAPVDVGMHYNSAYPRDRNNGVLWAGAGLNGVVRGGVQARWRWLEAAVIPAFAYQGNADHPTLESRVTGRSPFSDPFHARRFDAPPRFGDEPFSTLDLGRSFVSASAGAFEARLSNENLWLGPAQIFPLLLSNTAQGFPHLRLGTRRPVDIRIGALEFGMFWGSVGESAYYDGDEDDDSHLFAGVSVIFEPVVLPGLHLGAARIQHVPEGALGHGPAFYLESIFTSPTFAGGGNIEGNGIGALFARWVLPESGFEAYIEWARDDTPFNLQDLIREPDWSQATTMGFQKVFLTPERLIRLFGEIVNVGQSTPVRAGKGIGSFYGHGGDTGHTHEGQLLGAGLGIGSNARALGVELYTAEGRTGLAVEHARYDEDTYYVAFARRFGEARHDTELSLKAWHQRRWNNLAAEVGLRLSRRYDRDFITLVADDPPGVETNVGLDLTLSWRPNVALDARARSR